MVTNCGTRILNGTFGLFLASLMYVLQWLKLNIKGESLARGLKLLPIKKYVIEIMT